MIDSRTCKRFLPMSIGLLGSLLTNSTLGYPGISHLGLLRLDPNQIILEPGWWTVIRVYCFCRRLAHGLLLGAARWFIILAVAVTNTLTLSLKQLGCDSTLKGQLLP